MAITQPKHLSRVLALQKDLYSFLAPNRILRIFPSITFPKDLKEKDLRIGPEKGPERDKSERVCKSTRESARVSGECKRVNERA